MKARIPWKGTQSQRKAMRQEIGRQLVEMNEKFQRSYDATVLYALHISGGYGKKRLRRFYDAYVAEISKMKEFYETDDIAGWLCEKRLKAIGVDLEEWEKENEQSLLGTNHTDSR